MNVFLGRETYDFIYVGVKCRLKGERDPNERYVQPFRVTAQQCCSDAGVSRSLSHVLLEELQRRFGKGMEC